MKIANEKNIKLSNFFYELLNTNYDNLEREFKELGLDTDKIVFKISNNNLSNIVMLFPKNKDKPLKYFNYYLVVNFDDDIKIKYLVDEEELLDKELKLISSIIGVLKNNLSGYSKSELEEIMKLTN